MAAISREDAIDATAVSLTRRDGPDAVRNSSNSKKKPPTSSCDGHESYGTPRARLLAAAALHVLFAGSFICGFHERVGRLELAARMFA